MTASRLVAALGALVLAACTQEPPGKSPTDPADTDPADTDTTDTSADTSDDTSDTAPVDTAPIDTAPLDTGPFDRDGDGVPDADDCDDGDATTFPGAPLGCDGGDHDCDGAPDVPVDADGDGAACDVDCDDADPARAPGHPEVCGDGGDDDCVATPACRVGGDVLVSAARTRFVPEGAGYRLGSLLTRMGDVDGDGRSDFLVASRRDGGGTLSWFFGVTDPGDWEITRHLHNEGAGSDAEMPTVLSPGGDLNGDGRADVLLGIPEGGSSGDGVVQAWYTEGSTHQIRQLAQLGSSGSVCERLGASLGGGPTDLDGDGQDDLVAGDDACTAVAILPGPMDYWETHAFRDATLVRGDFGRAFATPGDIDGDGYDDLVLDAGAAVYVASGPFLGDTTPSGTTLDTSTSPLTTLAPAGDTDGDGRQEWLARRADGTCWLGGAVPGGAWNLEDMAVPLATGADGCDAAVPAGDIDGDALDDVLLLSAGLDAGAENGGGAWLLYGPVDGPRDATTDAGARFLGDEASLGISVAAAAGDVDADGYGDLLLGAPNADTHGADAGAAWLFLGDGE